MFAEARQEALVWAWLGWFSQDVGVEKEHPWLPGEFTTGVALSEVVESTTQPVQVGGVSLPELLDRLP